MSERGSITTSNGRRASVEDRLSEISTQDDPPPFSPSFSRNGFLSPSRETFQDVDIGASVPLPLSPVASHFGHDEPCQSHHGRLLTRSPSPSPAPRVPSPHPSMVHPPSPSHRPSSASVYSRGSGDAQLAGSTPSSPTLTASPVPRFIDFKPALPSATIALDGNVEGVDPNAPFENIPLGRTPPLPPLPSSPVNDDNNSRRRSHASILSASQSNPSRSTTSLSTSPRPASGSRREANGHAEPPAGPSTPPRRHAPPAHPHPFPIPDPAESSKTPAKSTLATSTALPQPSPAPAALGVKGASMLDKVISHTRPSWLPPKDKVEDETHYHQWEEMMAQARELEKERKKQAELRRLEREKRLAQNMDRWESLMRKDYNTETVRKDPSLRELWFEGIPSHLRGKAWSLAIGNPLAMSKEAYRSYLARARRSVESGRFPEDILEQMERDMDATLPTLRLYIRGSPMRDDLREFVCAWVVYRSDEGLAYAPYITHLAAMFLLNSPPSQAFLSLVNLLSRPCLRAFFTQTKDEIDAYYRVFENLQADLFPKIFANCKNLGLKLPESYFRSVFIEQVPFETCCRLWDQIMLDGDGYIFRAALAIFGFLEPRLHYPDKDEIASVLEGRNKATQAIVERERARAKLRGEAYDEALDGTLSVFGLNEGELFEWLSDDGWKESRFERLVTREMPD